jgi:hypothetical protein
MSSVDAKRQLVFQQHLDSGLQWIHQVAWSALLSSSLIFVVLLTHLVHHSANGSHQRVWVHLSVLQAFQH